MNNLRSQARVESQLHKAQESFTKEWTSSLKGMAKLFRDACSLYDTDTLDEMLNDLQDIVNEARENYDEFKNSSRFLNQTEAEDQDIDLWEEKETPTDAKSLPMLVSTSLPEVNDDETILTHFQVRTLLSDHPPTTLHKLRDSLSITRRLKNPESIFKAGAKRCEPAQFSKKGITHKKLLELIQLCESQNLLLADLNGKGG